MIFKRFILFIGLINLAAATNLYAKAETVTESDQQISDFSLAGYGEKGKKSWDISGKSADIFTEEVKLKEVVGNMYGKEEDMRLIADKGDFNKVNGKVHLEQNVVITTSSGTKLTTDSLDWDRKNQLVTTRDPVNIQRQDMVVDAVVRNFELIGEAAKNIPESIQKKYPEVPWKKMYGLRNLISHEYFGIDYEMIWEIAKVNLPKNIEDLRRIIDEEKKYVR
jgi:LPS export ABC transporter protein LptC